CAPTFFASLRAFRRDCGESRVTISVIVKPVASSTKARKVARLPAPTMATVGFLAADILTVFSTIGFSLLGFRLNRAAYLILLSWRKQQKPNQQLGNQGKPASSLPESVTAARCSGCR